MFKEMGQNQGAQGGSGASGDGSGLPGPDDPIMNMFKGLMSGGGDGGGPGGEDGTAEMFKQFTQFLESQGDEKLGGGDEFKGLLDSVVKDILSKDSLYKPMKILKDEYPDWLEKNWENISQEDLERYNQ